MHQYSFLLLFTAVVFSLNSLVATAETSSDTSELSAFVLNQKIPLPINQESFFDHYPHYALRTKLIYRDNSFTLPASTKQTLLSDQNRFVNQSTQTVATDSFGKLVIIERSIELAKPLQLLFLSESNAQSIEINTIKYTEYYPFVESFADFSLPASKAPIMLPDVFSLLPSDFASVELTLGGAPVAVIDQTPPSLPPTSNESSEQTVSKSTYNNIKSDFTFLGQRIIYHNLHDSNVQKSQQYLMDLDNDDQIDIYLSLATSYFNPYSCSDEPFSSSQKDSQHPDRIKSANLLAPNSPGDLLAECVFYDMKLYVYHTKSWHLVSGNVACPEGICMLSD